MFVNDRYHNTYWITGTPTCDEANLMLSGKTPRSEKDLRKELWLRFIQLGIAGIFLGSLAVVSLIAVLGLNVASWIPVPTSCLIAIYTIAFYQYAKREMKRCRGRIGFFQRNRIVTIDSSESFCALYWELYREESGTQFLERHKQEVDDFLLDPDIRRTDDLLARRDLSQAQRQALKKAVEARVEHLIVRLKTLDRPYQEAKVAEEAAEKEAEEAKRLNMQLDKEARRQVADNEAAWLIRQLSNEQ